jgi:hypothetical protein
MRGVRADRPSRWIEGGREVNAAARNEAAKPLRKSRAKKPPVTATAAVPEEKKAPKAKVGKFAGVATDELRMLLLATPTIADSAWAPARGVPARNEGETRADYIVRVLSA